MQLPTDPERLSTDLLAWYDVNRRSMPWRAPPGQPAEPYHVWLSEIMLQQTTVKVVIPYFNRFVAQWPTLRDLAASPPEDILAAWAGLGYYARARNLHRCAVLVCKRYDGRFPEDEATLRTLPGIGHYTAAAIAAIVSDRPATPVDGNVERVFARLHALETPLPAAKPQLRRLAAACTPQQRPGDHAQALMDLGATVCIPRNPRCTACPWRPYCAGNATGMAADLPRRLPRRAKPTRYGIVFWCCNQHGRVLMRRRPPTGLLGGLPGFPSTPWTEVRPTPADVAAARPHPGPWRTLPGVVRHGFTHFNLEVTVCVADIDHPAAQPGDIWLPADRLDDAGLPSLMRAVASHARERV